ncbi:DNA repair protein RAD51 3-like isoform X3, partial [Dinothrombium tinctorium]
LQLCVNVQIPQCFGGVEGEVLFIETENSFIPSRFVEIASHTIEEIKQLLIDKNIPIDLNSEQNFTCETLMKHIYMKRCSNAKELYTIIVHKIEEFLKDYSQVKLIIIDSIAFPFRYDYEDDNMEKIKMLLSISQKLKQIAFNHSLCVVVTNQITHDVEESKSKASLGPTWSHCSNVSILLEYDRNLNKRYISTTKNFHKKKKLEFEIDARGFRGKEKIV